MKKIYWLIIFFLSLILAPQKIGAAQAINISFDPQTAKVGDKITVEVNITDAPYTDNVYLYISDAVVDTNNLTGATPYLKARWDPPTRSASAGYQYIWDTAAANSNPGVHYITVIMTYHDPLVLQNPDLNVVALENHTTYNLAAAGDTGDQDQDQDQDQTEDQNNENDDDNTKKIVGGFDLGNLGKISFLPTKINDAKELMAVIINWLLTFVGALAVIALIYSGVMYITAGGDAAKAENAKKNIVWAIVGILIAISALIIVNVIAQAFHG